MRFLLLFAFLVLPSFAQAQAGSDKCLVEFSSDNRASGTVAYASFRHPGTGVAIGGYKIVLLQPRCYDHRTIADVPANDPVTEIAVLPFSHHLKQDAHNTFFHSWDGNEQIKELDRYLKQRIGKTVIITGEMQTNLTAYYVAVPQIVVESLIDCGVAPKSKSTTKC